MAIVFLIILAAAGLLLILICIAAVTPYEKQIEDEEQMEALRDYVLDKTSKLTDL